MDQSGLHWVGLLFRYEMFCLSSCRIAQTASPSLEVVLDPPNNPAYTVDGVLVLQMPGGEARPRTRAALAGAAAYPHPACGAEEPAPVGRR